MIFLNCCNLFNFFVAFSAIVENRFLLKKLAVEKKGLDNRKIFDRRERRSEMNRAYVLYKENILKSVLA